MPLARSICFRPRSRRSFVRFVSWNSRLLAWLRGELECIAADYALCCGLWRVEANRVILIEAAESPLAEQRRTFAHTCELAAAGPSRRRRWLAPALQLMLQETSNAAGQG